METRERTKETFPALWLLGCKSDSRSGGKNCIEWGEGFDRRDLPRDWGRHVQLCKRGLEPGPHPRYQVSLEWILPVELSAGNGLSVLPHLLLGCFFTIACSIICKLFASAQLLSVLIVQGNIFLPGEITVFQVFLSLSRKSIHFVYVSAMLAS